LGHFIADKTVPALCLLMVIRLVCLIVFVIINDNAKGLFVYHSLAFAVFGFVTGFSTNSSLPSMDALPHNSPVLGQSDNPWRNGGYFDEIWVIRSALHFRELGCKFVYHGLADHISASIYY
jgi:hypothetical protein